MLMIETAQDGERALIVIISENRESEYRLKRQEEEAVSLLETLGIQSLSTLFFNVRERNSSTLIGRGQAEEVRQHTLFFATTLVYFDTSLSPRISRNLESYLQQPVLDRNELIIEIFASRARTREARLQVALARAQFLLPRLKQGINPYSQQRGGVRGAKGEGEKQIELDRRQLEKVIVKLRREIENVRKDRTTQRKKRLSSSVPSFALAGYTNSGKSSLVKALTDFDTLAEDKLFATLDPLEKTLELEDGLSVILCDTVGFVSNLPHFLIDAFSSTLEEARLADVLILVLDSSSEDIISNYETTKEVLTELRALDKPVITVLNKCDLKNPDDIALARIKTEIPDAIPVSAKTGENLDRLILRMKEETCRLLSLATLTLAASDSAAIEEVYRTRQVVSARYTENSVTFLLWDRKRPASGPQSD